MSLFALCWCEPCKYLPWPRNGDHSVWGAERAEEGAGGQGSGGAGERASELTRTGDAFESDN